MTTTRSGLKPLRFFRLMAAVIAILASVWISNTLGSVASILAGLCLLLPEALRSRQPALNKTAFNAILKHNPDPLIVVNQAGTIVAANPAANILFASANESLEGYLVDDFVPTEFRAGHAAMRDQFFAQQSSAPLRNCIQANSLSGERLQIELHMRHLVFRGEHLAVVSIRDIAEQQQVIQRLETSEQSYRALFERATIGLAHVSLGGTVVRVNETLAALLGYQAHELLHRQLSSLMHSTDQNLGLKLLTQALDNQVPPPQLMGRLITKDGQPVWVKLASNRVDIDESEPHFILSVLDISDLKVTEKQLVQSENTFKSIVETLSKEMVVWTATPGLKKLIYVNEGYPEIWGQTRESLFDEPLSFLNWVHPNDRARVNQHYQNPLTGNWAIDYRIVREDGETRFIHDVGLGIYDGARLLQWVGAAMDRTAIMERQTMLDDSLDKLKIAYRSLEVAASRDALTGVLNRSALFREISTAHERYKRYNTPATLVFIDLNRFKEVNDHYGHVAGDQVLVAVVNHLKSRVRQTDRIGRYGGDEFIVLLENSDQQMADEFCQRVGKTIEVSLSDNQSLEAGLAFGVCQLSSDMSSVEAWVDQADSVMYDAKTDLQ